MSRSSLTAASSLSTSTLLVSSRAWARIGRSSGSVRAGQATEVARQRPRLPDERGRLPGEVHERSARCQDTEPGADVEDRQREIHGRTLHRRSGSRGLVLDALRGPRALNRVTAIMHSLRGRPSGEDVHVADADELESRGAPRCGRRSPRHDRRGSASTSTDRPHRPRMATKTSRLMSARAGTQISHGGRITAGLRPRTRAMRPPPRHSSPSYRTAACPGAGAQTGSAVSTTKRSWPTMVTSAGTSGARWRIRTDASNRSEGGSPGGERRAVDGERALRDLLAAPDDDRVADGMTSRT